MATSPVVEFPQSLASMVLALRRNRAVPADDSDTYDQACRNVYQLERSIAARVDALLLSEGVTMADLIEVGL